MCVAGTRWVQDELLSSIPSADVKIYAVWFSMFPTDSRAAWPRDLLVDRRVTHLWDERKAVGRWYGGHSDYGTFQEDGVLWDAYLLYAPNSRWNDSPSHLVGWGYTIVGKREELRSSLIYLVRSSPAVGPPARRATVALPAP